MIKNPLRFSRWTHVLERDGIFAIFHSLNLSLIFLENKYQVLIEKLKFGVTMESLKVYYNDAEEVLTELLAENLIVSFEYDDNLILKEKQQKYIRWQPTLETIFLLLTDVCNLKCKYCFINENMPNDYENTPAMKWETAEEAIDMYFKNLRPTKSFKSIVFYGGEPLLVFPLLQRIMNYIKTKHQVKYAEFNVGPLIITNGTKISGEVANYLALNKDIGICISLDGNKDTNDSLRIYHDGKGCFEDIMIGIQRLHLAGRKDISISATIDLHNIDKLDELIELHKKFNFESVSFNLLLDTIKREIDPLYTEEATAKMLKYFEKARELGLYEDRIMRKVRSISKGNLHPYDCRATGAQLAVSPDGALGICHEGIGCKTFFFGRVSSDFSFQDHPMIQEWGKRSPLTMPQCFNCISLGLCGGGCAYSAYLRHGTIWSIDDKFCMHSLAVLKWIIWDVYKQL